MARSAFWNDEIWGLWPHCNADKHLNHYSLWLACKILLDVGWWIVPSLHIHNETSCRVKLADLYILELSILSNRKVYWRSIITFEPWPDVEVLLAMYLSVVLAWRGKEWCLACGHAPIHEHNTNGNKTQRKTVATMNFMSCHRHRIVQTSRDFLFWAAAEDKLTNCIAL